MEIVYGILAQFIIAHTWSTMDHEREFVNAQSSNEGDSFIVKQNKKFNLSRNEGSCVITKINFCLLGATAAWINRAKK
jgi:hypothetical protein